MTRTILRYDTEPCGRCGGSGHYSRCQRYGTVCFDCHGRKTRVTRAGKNASTAVQTFIAEHYSVPVESLTAGDRIQYEGKFRTVTSVAVSDSTGRYTSNGETVTKHYIAVEFAVPVRTAYGPLTHANMLEGSTVVKLTDGYWDTIVAFARTIKKGVTVTTDVQERAR